jgi:hypothetical protein
MKKQSLIILMTLISMSVMSQGGGAMKIFETGDIVIGGLSVGGFGLNLQPCGYMYNYNQVYGAYGWSNSIQANDNLTTNNMVFRGLSCNSWDRGDGVRWARLSFQTGSDRRLKTNIEDIKNPLEAVLKLHGVSFQFLSQLKDFEPDTTIIIDKYGKKQLIITREEDRWKDTTRFPSSIVNQLKEEITWKHFGVIAQEVQTVIPEAVRTMPDGTLAVEYNAFIPFLIESVKILQNKLDSCLSYYLTQKPNQSSGILKNSIENKTESILYQNMPNPFSESTRIKYKLDQNVQSASILIFDMQGSLLKTFNRLDKIDEIVVNSYELKPGMYLYSLITDGIEIDTKRMILTK